MKNLVLIGGLFLSGCTLWWGFNQDPEGLPCDADGRCLAQYTCVEAAGEKICVKAAAKTEGEVCVDVTECELGLACANAYTEACGEDLNCALGAALDGELRCRRECDPAAAPAGQCAGGQRCFANNAGTGFCQGGTCTQDNECGVNALNGEGNRCFGLINGEGSGLCASGCDPFDCAGGAVSCGGCPAIDITGDGSPEIWGCEPVDATAPGRFGCIVAGNVPAGGQCGDQAFCQAGSFCTNVISQGSLCASYCNVTGGAPQCDAGFNCLNLDGVVGFCN